MITSKNITTFRRFRSYYANRQKHDNSTSAQHDDVSMHAKDSLLFSLIYYCKVYLA